MQPTQDKMESLHQQAAAYYLQGEFEKALEFWQQLLSLDADDERAQEGVRLCEMLAEDGNLLNTPAASSIPVANAEVGTNIVQSSHSAQAAPASPPPAPTAAPAATPEVAAPPVAAMPDLDPEGLDGEDLGWDLSKLDLGEFPAEAVATVPTPPLVDPSGDVAAAFDAPAAAPPSGAVGELQVRVDELVIQASRADGAGGNDGALGFVSRVFILDEMNAAALNLQKTIQAEIEQPEGEVLGEGLAFDEALEAIPDADAMPAAADDDPLEGGELLEGLPDAMPAAAADEVFEADELFEGLPDAEAVPSPPAADLAPSPLLDAVDTDSAPDPSDIPMAGIEAIPDGVRLAQRVAATADPGKQRGAGLLSRKFLAIYAVGLIVVLAAGWGVLKFIGGSANSELDETVRQMQAIETGAKGKGGKNEEKKGQKDKQGDGVTEEAPVLTPADLPGLLARAQAAAAAGEFSKAIIAYNQTLEIDPNHAVAKAGLASAGESYREQRAYQDKLDTVAAAWGKGDFTAAMRIFYRLPEAEGNPVFDRYKQNGWYNLGLEALTAGSCVDAKAHFDELKALGDKEGAELRKLAGAPCTYDRNLPEYRQQVDALKLRALED